MNDSYLGVASLVIVAISIHIWFRALKRVEIPQNRSGFVATWLVAAVLAVTALAGEPGWLGGVPAGFAVFLSTFFLFTVLISAQKLSDDAIRVGATIPTFTATDEHGQTFDSRSLAGHPVLIKFFRGHW